ncbi:hypothetical protein LSH36_582g01010 [Paralvinella palmiformis]|uniref:Uncharacterized protein n=1 Tax=Paralvinella palmiformis TaxID=53620 RepID=A0AAD9J6P0_9ANNE|nr:hypothetical protein LSH36_582g01010 [Paralvinella palmiformis]
METVSVSAVWELFVPILFRLFVLVAGYVRWDDMAVYMAATPHGAAFTQLAYPQPQGTPILQAVTLDEHAGAAMTGEDHYGYGQTK